MLKRTIAFLICFCLVFEQAGFAQVAGPLGVPAYLSSLAPVADKFRPVQLRSIEFDPATNNVQLLLDKGDLKILTPSQTEESSQKFFEYFQVGLAVPNSMFWVNLRPDSPDDVIEPDLEKTDLGRILLEADVQLKKDVSRLSSPDTPAGRQYWDKLYTKAEELYGAQDMEIPTLTRPWIVPGEIIIRESGQGAFIYKAGLKVMLEQDYLSRPAINSEAGSRPASSDSWAGKDSPFYKFDDPRLKALNEYSSELIRQLIIPQLTREVNSSKRYAQLRQVYYSLVLAQWFKSKSKNNGSSVTSHRSPVELGALASKIDTKDLTGLTSKQKWTKDTYYKAYQKSFQQGEYSKEETVQSQYGLTVRQYFSGGVMLGDETGSAVTVIQGGAAPLNVITESLISATSNYFSGLATTAGVVPAGAGQAAAQQDGGETAGLNARERGYLLEVYAERKNELVYEYKRKLGWALEIGLDRQDDPSFESDPEKFMGKWQKAMQGLTLLKEGLRKAYQYKVKDVPFPEEEEEKPQQAAPEVKRPFLGRVLPRPSGVSLTVLLLFGFGIIAGGITHATASPFYENFTGYAQGQPAVLGINNDAVYPLSLRGFEETFSPQGLLAQFNDPGSEETLLEEKELEQGSLNSLLVEELLVKLEEEEELYRVVLRRDIRSFVATVNKFVDDPRQPVAESLTKKELPPLQVDQSPFETFQRVMEIEAQLDHSLAAYQEKYGRTFEQDYETYRISWNISEERGKEDVIFLNSLENDNTLFTHGEGKDVYDIWCSQKELSELGYENLFVVQTHDGKVMQREDVERIYDDYQAYRDYVIGQYQDPALVKILLWIYFIDPEMANGIRDEQVRFTFTDEFIVLLPLPGFSPAGQAVPPLVAGPDGEIRLLPLYQEIAAIDPIIGTAAHEIFHNIHHRQEGIPGLLMYIANPLPEENQARIRGDEDNNVMFQLPWQLREYYTGRMDDLDLEHVAFLYKRIQGIDREAIRNGIPPDLSPRTKSYYLLTVWGSTAIFLSATGLGVVGLRRGLRNKTPEELMALIGRIKNETGETGVAEDEVAEDGVPAQDGGREMDFAAAAKRLTDIFDRLKNAAGKEMQRRDIDFFYQERGVSLATSRDDDKGSDVTLLKWLIGKFQSGGVAEIEMAYMLAHELTHIRNGSLAVMRKHRGDASVFRRIEIEDSIGAVKLMLESGYEEKEAVEGAVRIIRRLDELKAEAQRDGKLRTEDATFDKETHPYEEIARAVEERFSSGGTGQQDDGFNDFCDTLKKGEYERLAKLDSEVLLANLRTMYPELIAQEGLLEALVGFLKSKEAPSDPVREIAAAKSLLAEFVKSNTVLFVLQSDNPFALELFKAAVESVLTVAVSEEDFLKNDAAFYKRQKEKIRNARFTKHIKTMDCYFWLNKDYVRAIIDSGGTTAELLQGILHELGHNLVEDFYPASIWGVYGERRGGGRLVRYLRRAEEFLADKFAIDISPKLGLSPDAYLDSYGKIEIYRGFDDFEHQHQFPRYLQHVLRENGKLHDFRFEDFRKIFLRNFSDDFTSWSQWKPIKEYYDFLHAYAQGDTDTRKENKKEFMAKRRAYFKAAEEIQSLKIRENILWDIVVELELFKQAEREDVFNGFEDWLEKIKSISPSSTLQSDGGTGQPGAQDGDREDASETRKDDSRDRSADELDRSAEDRAVDMKTFGEGFSRHMATARKADPDAALVVVIAGVISSGKTGVKEHLTALLKTAGEAVVFLDSERFLIPAEQRDPSLSYPRLKFDVDEHNKVLADLKKGKPVFVRFTDRNTRKHITLTQHQRQRCRYLSRERALYGQHRLGRIADAEIINAVKKYQTKTQSRLWFDEENGEVFEEIIPGKEIFLVISDVALLEPYNERRFDYSCFVWMPRQQRRGNFIDTWVRGEQYRDIFNSENEVAAYFDSLAQDDEILLQGVSYADAVVRPPVTVRDGGTEREVKDQRQNLPRTIADYFRLSESQKNDLRKELFKKLRRVVSSGGKPLDLSHSLVYDERMEQLEQAAAELARKYPGARLVSLGRSPLWFLETARLLNGEKGEYIFAAFSGSWFYRQRRLPDSPNKEQIRAYRLYLERIGLHPAEINRTAQQGEKTILIEFADSGSSLNSFLGLLTDWARELNEEKSLKDSIAIHLLQNPGNVKPDNPHGFEMVQQKIGDKLLWSLMDEPSLGISYPFQKWGQEDIREAYPISDIADDDAALVRFRIMDFLAGKNQLPQAGENGKENSADRQSPAQDGGTGQEDGWEKETKENNTVAAVLKQYFETIQDLSQDLKPNLETFDDMAWLSLGMLYTVANCKWEQAIPAVKKLQPGGVLIGTGTGDPSLSWLCHNDFSKAIIIDYNHYGALAAMPLEFALISMARSRAEYLALLTGVEFTEEEIGTLTDDPGKNRLVALSEIISRVEDKVLEGTDDARMRNIDATWKTIKDYFPARDDISTRAKDFWDIYARQDRKIFASKMSEKLADLSASMERGDGWLSNERNFNKIKKMLREGKIIGVYADFSSKEGMERIWRYLRENKLEISAVYVSNIKSEWAGHIPGAIQRIDENLGRAPATGDCIYIESYYDEEAARKSKIRWVGYEVSVSGFADFLKSTQAKARLPQDASALKNDQQQSDGGVKGGIDSQQKDLSGIDFRALPVSGQPAQAPVMMPQVKREMQKLAKESKMQDLDKEWKDIEARMRTSKMPYDRIKEYIAVCEARPGAGTHLDKTVCCILNILRIEEEQALPTSQELKDLLTYIG